MTTAAYRLMTNEYTNPAYPRAINEVERGLPPPFRTLEMAGVLQTTLDLGELMDLFLREMQGHVEMDGLRYRQGDQGLEIKKGDLSRHSVSYTLTVKKQRLGEIAFFRAVAFQPNEIRTLEDLLAALLYPLRNTLEYQRALQSALIDPLTGVNNRVAMEVVLKRELELARRRGTPLAVILLDVDFFKDTNDRFGHHAGDQVLVALAQLIGKGIRKTDVAARWGGEEFLVLCPETAAEGASRVADKLRAEIAAHRFGRIGGKTASFGVADILPDDSAESLLRRADRALYAAKGAGRNAVKTVGAS